MDLFESFRIRHFSRGATLFFGVAISLLVLLCSILVLKGALDRRLSFVEAGTYLLAVVFPAFSLMGVLLVSSGGPKALESRTETFLRKLVPEVMEKSLGQSMETTVRPFEAEYLTTFSDGKQGKFRIELNVRRMNVCMFVPPHVSSEELCKGLRHTLENAEKEPSGYSWNPSLYPEPGVENCFVLSKMLERDFLWDHSDQLFVARDLAVMIRAMYQEYPGLKIGGSA